MPGPRQLPPRTRQRSGWSRRRRLGKPEGVSSSGKVDEPCSVVVINQIGVEYSRWAEVMRVRGEQTGCSGRPLAREAERRFAQC